MIRTAVTLEQAARRYDRLSAIYAINASLGSATSAEALRLARVREGDLALELAVGTGRDLARIARLVGTAGRVLGCDLSAGMLRQARQAVRKTGAEATVRLQRSDARHIPLRDAAVDVVFASRLMDLVDTPQLLLILAECLRVLKPGGRLVLVHMSKPDDGPHWFERLYRLPWFGGWAFVSRPVRVAPLLEALGFGDVSRAYRRSFPVGTEIVAGIKPA